MMYKYLLVALLSFGMTMVYADSYSGYYCKVNGKSVSGWDSKCQGRTENCNMFGYNCDYCTDCSSAMRVCKTKGGELWQAENWYSWRDGDGYNIGDCGFDFLKSFYSD